VFINAAGNALNDYYDQDIDHVNKPDRPLPSGQISPRGVWSYAIILFGIGVTISLFLNWVCIIIAGVNSVLLGLYASRLKQSGFFGNILISYLVASVFAFGGAAVDKLVIGAILAICAFFTNAAREILKDLEDVRGDELFGAKTLPALIGQKKTMTVVVAFLVIAILVSPLPYLLGILSEYYLLAVLIADFIFVVLMYNLLKKPTIKTARENQFIIKLGSIIGLVAFLAGTVPW
jgi:geranylgeranylglycerol-phosphate geranylgeranyltransferase